MIDPLLKKITLPILVTSIILASIHGALIESEVFKNFNLSYWWLIYAGLVPISLFGLGYIAHRYKKSEKITSIGINYIGYTVLKVLVAFAVLAPWLIDKDTSSKPMVAQFFSVFFPFLLVETILLVKLLNTPLDEKKEND